MTHGAGSVPLRLRKLRDLDLAQAPAPGRPAFLSAASGLVRSGGEWFVVADDELHLGCFAASGSEPGRLIRLFEGELPAEPRPRKLRKPDLEILLRLPGLPAHPHGALLALGSGSRPQRRRGALLGLDAQGHARDGLCIVDAAPLYERLQREFDELNLEGGWAHGNRLCLLQRGHKGGSPNAIVEFDYGEVITALMAEHALPAIAPRRLSAVDIGQVGDVPLCFTDACVLPDGSWLFSAVAEDTDDAFADGLFLGAAIGLMTRTDDIVWLRRLDSTHKIEGIEADAQGGKLHLWCVTDADDIARPAQLLGASLRQ